MVFILQTANENAERETAQDHSRAYSRGYCIMILFAPQVLGADDGRDRKKCYFNRTNRC